MSKHYSHDDAPGQVRCCPAGGLRLGSKTTLSRRSFLKGVGFTTLGTLGWKNVSWKSLSAEVRAFPEETLTEFRANLRVKPILIYDTPGRAHQTSWRAWGGIQTQREAEEEMARIRGELSALKKKADFPLEFLPVSGAKSSAEIDRLKEELAAADVVIVYAAGG